MKSILKWLKRLAILVVVVLTAGYGWLWWQLDHAGVSTHGEIDLGPGDITVPMDRSMAWSQRSALTDSLISLWAADDFKDWQEHGKYRMPRVLVGKLAAGKHIEEVNRYIQAAHVWGNVGTAHPYHTGDYDFTLAGLVLMLYNFGDRPDLLYPESVDHIVNVLMTAEGGTPVVYVPKILGLPLRDTENHILMTEGSRYLKNRWLALHGDEDPRYDNVSNGLEAFLLDYLAGMERGGLHEYNSRPYLGYTLTALMNLEAFSAEPVRAAARRILDRTNWEYALGSLSFRRWAPFNRQAGRSVDTDLDGDYHTGILKALVSLGGIEDLYVRRGEHQALWVPLTTYRLPDAVAEWMVSKPDDYFVRIGHGRRASPEIFSGGPGYLLSAGGVSHGRQQVARPTTLMLEDGAMDLKELLRMAGPGETYREWNNTGVHERFAVAAGPVLVPDGWEAVAENEVWSVFLRSGQRIATHSSDSLGVIYLLPEGEADALLRTLTAANDDPDVLRNRFTRMDGIAIAYDITASKDQWVIQSVGGQKTDRDTGTWPLMSGRVPLGK